MNQPISMAEKRAVLRDIAELQERFRYTMVDACAELHRSLPDVQRWRKELSVHDAKRALERAVKLYDHEHFSIRDAARRAMCSERELVRALQARGRRQHATPHIAMHNRGHRTTAY